MSSSHPSLYSRFLTLPEDFEVTRKPASFRVKTQRKKLASPDEGKPSHEPDTATAATGKISVTVQATDAEKKIEAEIKRISQNSGPDHDEKLPQEMREKINAGKIQAVIKALIQHAELELKLNSTTLEAPHSFKRLVLTNLAAAPLTALGAFLYIATTNGDRLIEIIDTMGSNLFQNQFFMVESINALINAGLNEELVNQLQFATLFSIPFGVATYVPAKNAPPLNMAGWKVGAFMQGLLNGIGTIPLNLFSRGPLVNILKALKEKTAEKLSNPMLEAHHTKIVDDAREKMAQVFQALIDQKKTPVELDAITMQRNFSLLEQLENIFQKVNTVPPIPPANSKLFDGTQTTLQLAGAVLLVWSSLGYGAAMAETVESFGASSAISQLLGHAMVSPLYALSGSAGASLKDLANLPWNIQKFFKEKNYFIHTWPKIIALAASLGISIFSYGSSLALIGHLTGWFGSSKLSKGVTIGFTDLFNMMYGALPAESIIRYLRRWFSSKENAERTDKFEQLLARQKQLADMPTDSFMFMIETLHEKNRDLLEKIFGKDEDVLKNLLDSIKELALIKNYKAAKEITAQLQQEKSDSPEVLKRKVEERLRDEATKEGFKIPHNESKEEAEKRAEAEIKEKETNLLTNSIFGLRYNRHEERKIYPTPSNEINYSQYNDPTYNSCATSINGENPPTAAAAAAKHTTGATDHLLGSRTRSSSFKRRERRRMLQNLADEFIPKRKLCGK